MALPNASSKFVVDYASAVTKFGGALQKFPVKKIIYRNIFRGKGLEFDSYRDFAYDDDSSLIDWMASLRAQKTMARKYIEERDLNVYFIVDVSNSMLFGSGKKLKAEYAAEMVLALAYLMLEYGDKVGLFLVDEHIRKYVPPGNGKRQFFSLVRILSDPDNYGGNFSLDGPIEEALSYVKTPYTVFIVVSDFIKLHTTTERNMNFLSAKYETLALMVRDPFDDELPNTHYQFSISDPYSNRQVLLDPDLAAREYKAVVQHHKERMRQIFLRTNIDLFEVSTKDEFYIPLASFLRGRARGDRI